MFNLEDQITMWRRGFSDKFSISMAQLSELELHLRDLHQDFREIGQEDWEAWKLAQQQLGDTDILLSEFQYFSRSNFGSRIGNFLSYYFEKEVVMRIVIGLGVGCFFFLAGTLLEGGQLARLSHLNGAFIVFGCAFGALLMTYPYRIVLRSLRLALTGMSATELEYAQAAAIFESFGNLTVLAGFVGLTVGLIHVMGAMDVSVAVIGKGLGVSLVSLLYGLVAKLLIAKPLGDGFRARITGVC